MKVWPQWRQARQSCSKYWDGMLVTIEEAGKIDAVQHVHRGEDRPKLGIGEGTVPDG